MFDNNLFFQSISETINCWPSLQLSLSNGMGGPLCQEKITWLCNGIVQLFHDNQNLIIDDLCDFVSTVLNNEFDTIIEDGSLEMVCTSIFCFHCKISLGDCEYVQNKLNILKQKYHDSNKYIQELTNSQNYEESSSTEKLDKGDISEIKMDVDDEPKKAPDDNNDGWTVVRRRK